MYVYVYIYIYIFFFGMDRYTLLETEVDFTELLLIKNSQVLSKFSREMLSSEESYTNLQTLSIA